MRRGIFGSFLSADDEFEAESGAAMSSGAALREKLQEQLQEAAYKWWCGRRPVSWSEAKHRENPTVNCTGPRENNLALVVSLLRGEAGAPDPPKPLNIEELRESCHMTYNGGWHGNEDGMKAFHHGMDTVCNVLEHSGPLFQGAAVVARVPHPERTLPPADVFPAIEDVLEKHCRGWNSEATTRENIAKLIDQICETYTLEVQRRQLVERALAEAQESRPAPPLDWQPIETAPKDGTPIRLKWDKTTVEAIGRWCPAKEWPKPYSTDAWRDVKGDDVLLMPTHWKPEALRPAPAALPQTQESK